ncbi:hypothetical protein [Demequina lutea]|uniref:Tetratricopeptide (TPR) repeat protein n=1 Tax=Demequina lutea TaxID=431489 RepID=A0A7Z0CH56_9MICO|nr:hypothetical protein [Demequina lutea]NYI41146.1 tetratricopeptide (TPR) repeat protein [Demequina lutea]
MPCRRARLGSARLGSAGSYDESQRRYSEALQLVGDDDASNLRNTILNNSAFTYFLSHEMSEALAAVDHLLRVSAINDRPLAMHVRDTVGRVYLTAGRVAEAERVLAPAMDAQATEFVPETVATCLVTLAEVHRTQGEFGRAQEVIDRCQELCRTYELSRCAADAAREQAEIFAATGNFRGAYEAYQDFHSRIEAHSASSREARGKLLKAAFQTTEARRETARYHDLAERDPLTLACTTAGTLTSS